MGCESSTRPIRRGSEHRNTSQSLLILWVIQHVKTYLIVPQIEYNPRQLHPALNVSTVDEHLTMFKSLYRISETRIGGGELLRGWKDQEKHHNISCLHCFAIIKVNDIYIDVIEQVLVNDYELSLNTNHCVVPGICPRSSGTLEQNRTQNGI